MKGQTNSALDIWVWAPWTSHPAIEALRAKGHCIVNMNHKLSTATTQTPEPDLILHPAAHGWCEAMFVTEEKKDGTKYTPYLDAALTAARKRKREAR